ncbi:MAG: thioredoxin [Rhizobacter sp.]|nr:thioredoxin [Rhizobacter sp.]
MPNPTASLPDELGRKPGTLTVVLFSQEGCAYCHTVREHYLRPLAATRPAGLVIAEVELGSRRMLLDWQGTRRSHADIARAHGARFAPTVMFFDPQGRELAPAIVGLSQDFFGAYLDSRIVSARAALRSASAPAPRPVPS